MVLSFSAQVAIRGKKSYTPRSLVIPALSSGVIWGIAQVRSDLRFSHWVRMGKGQRWGLAKSPNSRLFEDNTLVSLFRFMANLGDSDPRCQVWLRLQSYISPGRLFFVIQLQRQQSIFGDSFPKRSFSTMTVALEMLTLDFNNH